MTHHNPITISISQRILEHPEAIHLRRMRAAIWLYLVLLGRIGSESDEIEIDPAETALAMGVHEGTIRSWIGHLRKWRYVDARRTNGSVLVRVRRAAATTASEPPKKPKRVFAVENLAKSLGETDDREALEQVLEAHPDDVIRQALARTLAVPEEKIRKSRTALFLYLLKQHEEDK